MSLTIRMFAHSLVSDWNHGNAHFLRGFARALTRMGHDVRCYEQLGSWSLSNLVQVEGERAIDAIDDFRRAYPELSIHFYQNDAGFQSYIEEDLQNADVVLIHEWNDPHIVNQVLALKERHNFLALLHDTHHRAYTQPGQILRFHMHKFDGVLAFGEAIRKIYSDGFGVARTFTFHEAADVDEFRPLEAEKSADLLWIGNWGDEERTRELQEFLIEPAAAVGGKTVVHGVRYPAAALEKLRSAGIEYRGYLPNLQAPRAYSESKLAIHVPRRQYANGLAGVPTIRVFEALACGVPLVCSPWTDAENLFRPGEDYVVAESGEAMQAEIAHLLRDDAARAQLASNGLETVRNRHTCAHRAQQFIEILEEMQR